MWSHFKDDIVMIVGTSAVDAGRIPLSLSQTGTEVVRGLHGGRGGGGAVFNLQQLVLVEVC